MVSNPVSLRPWPLVVMGLAFPFLALGTQLALWESVQPLAFILFYPAVVLSSWIGGWIAGSAAIVLSTVLARCFFMTPTEFSLLPSSADMLRTLTFVGFGSVIVWAHHRFQLRTEQLALALEKYRNVAENIEDVVWVLDASTLKLLYVSPSVFRLLGYTPDELISTPSEIMLPPTMLALLRDWPANAQGQGHPIANDVEVHHKTRGTLWAEIITIRVSNPRTGRLEFHGVSRDISQRKKTEAYIRHMAQHDALTGLPNRVLFDEHVAATLALARRNGTSFGLMFIDLDNFKKINDSFGHRVGDLLLQGVTTRLLQTVRASDAPARIGGDEFVVLLREIRASHDALPLAEKVRLALCEPFEIEGHTFAISASIGIALYPDHGFDAIELSRSADAAMYQAKGCGRNQVTIALEAALLP